MYTAKRGYRPGDEPVPQYHLIKFLGRGQFGEVWQAKGPGGMQVALKMIDLAGREGLKEFTGLQKVKDIRHANLVEFVACWVKTDDGQVLDEVPVDQVAGLAPRDSSIDITGTMLYDSASSSRPVELVVAMSLGSKTLFRRLQEINHGRPQSDWSGLPEQELLDYMEQAARGLDFLNQQGIIHGDIKPQNLLIVGNSVKVCDFGLAQAVDSLRKTQSGMGTVAYAAPELFEGKPHVHSDQYCLAISYIELRTGSLPFDERNPYEVIQLHCQGKLDLQKLVPAERNVIRRATAINPEKRWSSCFEMVARLRECRQASASSGFWPSLFGGRATSSERLAPGEVEGPQTTMKSKSARQAASERSDAVTPSLKPDSTSRKSAPGPAGHSGLARTQPRRGDDTDDIAATLPSAPLPEPPKPARRQWASRFFRAVLAVGLVAALAAGGVWIADHFVPATPERFQVEFDRAVALGDFRKAADVVDKALKRLSAENYNRRFLPEIKKTWEPPSTNPVLQQLRDGKMQLHEAAVRLRNADAENDFVRHVGPVPEDIWRALLEQWTKELWRCIVERDLQAAEELATNAKQFLDASQYQQLLDMFQKTWGDPAANPVVSQLQQGAITPAEAYSQLKAIGAIDSLGKLLGPTTPEVWRAVVKAWNNEFTRSLFMDLAKAADLWESVQEWKDLPSEVISAEQKARLKSQLQDEWKKQTKFAELIDKKDFPGIRQVIDTPLAEKIFTAAGIEGLRKEVEPRWTTYFDALISDGPPEKLIEAAELLGSVGAFFDSPAQHGQKVKAFGTQWSGSMGGLAGESKNWRLLDALFDAGGKIVTPEERDHAQRQAAATVEKKLARHNFQEAAQLLDDLKSSRFISPTDMQRLEALVWEIGEKGKPKGNGPMPPADSPIAVVKKAVEAVEAGGAAPQAIGKLLDALELHFPANTPETWKLDEHVVAVLTDQATQALSKLAEQIGEGGQPKYESHGKDLERARTWLFAARNKLPHRRVAQAALAVATGRLAVRVWEPAMPVEADWQEISLWQEDFSARREPDSLIALMARAWRAECMMILNKDASQALNIVVVIRDELEKKAKQPEYAQYLMCQAMKAAGTNWGDLTSEVGQLVPRLNPVPPILQVQNRGQNLALLIVAAAVHKRQNPLRPWSHIAQWPFNPYDSADGANQYAAMLDVARALLGRDLGAEGEISVVLAAFHKSPPDMETVRSRVDDLLKSADNLEQPDLVPRLYVGASSFWRDPTWQTLPVNAPRFQAAIHGTAMLLERLSEDTGRRSPSSEQATAFYEAILKPLLDEPFQAKLAAEKSTGSKPLSDLAGALAKFLDSYSQQYAEWASWPPHLPSVYDAIERYATWAIDLAPNDLRDRGKKLADYLAIRADARTRKPRPDLDQALEDATAARKVAPSLHRASGVVCYVFTERAKKQPSPQAAIEDLRKAIQAGEQAISDCPEKETTARIIYWLNTGQANLLWGNLEIDRKARREHFQKALDYARKATASIGPFDHPARLLLGNVYEDLASVAGEEPRRNYREARKCFEDILDKKPLSAEARVGLARCTQKALIQTGLTPPDLGLTDSRDVILRKCAGDLEMVTRQIGVHAATRSETYYFLSETLKALGDWKKADENVTRAWEIAKGFDAGTAAAYCQLWARFPLDWANSLGTTNPGADALLAEAERRAEELRKLPASLYVSPAQQAALLIGRIREFKGKWEEAEKAYSQGLPADLADVSARDVPLLLARAKAVVEQGDRKVAETAIRDARRVLELKPALANEARAHYCLALANFLLFEHGGRNAIPQRDQSLESMRNAVALLSDDNAKRFPGEALEYRFEGSKLITKIVIYWIKDAVAEDPTFNRKVVDPYLAEAEEWLQDALPLTAAGKEEVQDALTKIRDFRKSLSGADGAGTN